MNGKALSLCYGPQIESIAFPLPRSPGEAQSVLCSMHSFIPQWTKLGDRPAPAPAVVQWRLGEVECYCPSYVHTKRTAGFLTTRGTSFFQLCAINDTAVFWSASGFSKRHCAQKIAYTSASPVIKLTAYSDTIPDRAVTTLFLPVSTGKLFLI